MKLNNYYVYGLKIKSEIEIEEFVKLDNIADEDVVTISYSTMSDDIKEKIKEGIRINLSNNKIWFHINDIATYCVSNVNRQPVN